MGYPIVDRELESAKGGVYSIGPIFADDYFSAGFIDSDDSLAENPHEIFGGLYAYRLTTNKSDLDINPDEIYHDIIESDFADDYPNRLAGDLPEEPLELAA